MQWEAHPLVVPAGSLVAGPGPWRVTSHSEASQRLVLGFHPGVVNDGWANLPPGEGLVGDAAAMDYWLIEPLVGARLSPPRSGASKGPGRWWRSKALPFGGVLPGATSSTCSRAFAEAAPAPAATPPWVTDRLLYLHAQLAHQPTLALTARQAGMNRDAFSRRVKAETGQTFHDLLTDLRLRKAEWLVRQTRLLLARVAEEVGLRDQTHFTRLFKAHYAATPSRYRWGQPGRKAEGF